MMKCAVRKAGIASILLALVTAGCGGGGGSDGDVADTQDQTQNSIVAAITKSSLFVHPTDPALLSFTTDAGESFALAGKRDLSGNPVTINELNYVDPQGRQYQILYDDSGVPTTVINEQGTSFTFDFFEGVSATGRALGRAAAFEDGVEVNSIAVSIKGQADGNAVQVETVVNLDQPLTVAPNQAFAAANAAQQAHNLVIKVNQCDAPANPAGGVAVHFRGKNQSDPNRYDIYKAYRTEQPGVYHALIPQPNPDWLDKSVADAWAAIEQGALAVDGTLDNVRAPCQRLAKSASILCGVVKPPAGYSMAQFALPFCTSLGAQMEVLDPLPGDSLVVIPTCMALFSGADSICSTLLAQDLNAHPNPFSDDSINVISAICEARSAAPIQYLNRASDGWDDKLIQAVADMRRDGVASLAVAGSNADVTYSSQVEVPATGPFPDLMINDTTPNIDRFVLSPKRPDPSQGYSASAEFSCVKNKELAMAYQGSDGMADLQFATPLTQRAEMSMDVPARSGTVIQDVFTVSARDPFTNVQVGKTIPVQFEAKAADTEPPPSTVPTVGICPQLVTVELASGTVLTLNYASLTHPYLNSSYCNYEQQGVSGTALWLILSYDAKAGACGQTAASGVLYETRKAQSVQRTVSADWVFSVSLGFAPPVMRDEKAVLTGLVARGVALGLGESCPAQ